MQLEKKERVIKFIELIAVGLGVVVNISFLHSVGVLKSAYFEIPNEISEYGLYLTSLIGAIVICKKLARFICKLFVSASVK